MQYNITYRKKDKGIQFIISYKDRNGKWRQKSKQGFKKQSVAKLAADKVLDELKKNEKIQVELDPQYEELSFKDFAEIFLKHEELYKEGNTLLSYRVAFRVFRDLNDMKISKIKSIDIQKCVDALTKKGLKSSSIKVYLVKINIMFNAALDKYKIISKNPVVNIDVIKDKTIREKRALTKHECDILLSKITNPKYYLISLISIKCGLRIGETIGLTWDDIDESNSIMNITKQWKVLKNGTYGFGTLKSKNGKRQIPIPPSLMNSLKKYKQTFPRNINNRLFNSAKVPSISLALSRYYKKIGFNISVHELRHTYATTLISNGVDFKTAAKLLGHDVKQTLEIYSHVNNDMLDNAKKIIFQIL
ncbi:site-specific integrase [Clostridium tyrobutyricum]|uniref:site-specific integrase n=1 Tax=Clostridium tyrobutyricum TaxID=1519 RepID=UPI00189FA7E1|nr:site-specific integrase [Clostridium tyrobutyricum]